MKKGYVCFLVCLLLLVFCLPVKAEDMAGMQKGPVLVSVKVNKKKALPGDRVQLSLKFKEPREIEELIAMYTTSTVVSSQEIALHYDKGSGEWRGTYKVAKGAPNGIHRLTMIMAKTTKGGAALYPNPLFLPKGNLDSFLAYPDMKSAQFRVSGSKVDLSAPVLDLKSLTVSRRNAKRGQKVTYSIKCTDDSRIRSMEIIVCDRQWEIGTVAMKYNTRSKRYEGSLKLDRDMKKGLLQIESIEAVDVHGNRRICINRFMDGKSDVSRADVRLH